MREAWIAEQLGALAAQPNHLADDGGVVGCAAVFAARDPGAIGLFAQIAPRRELQERLDRGAAQRDHIFPGKAAILGRLARRRANEVGQSGKIVLAFQHELK